MNRTLHFYRQGAALVQHALPDLTCRRSLPWLAAICRPCCLICSICRATPSPWRRASRRPITRQRVGTPSDYGRGVLGLWPRSRGGRTPARISLKISTGSSTLSRGGGISQCSGMGLLCLLLAVGYKTEVAQARLGDIPVRRRLLLRAVAGATSPSFARVGPTHLRMLCGVRPPIRDG